MRETTLCAVSSPPSIHCCPVAEKCSPHMLNGTFSKGCNNDLLIYSLFAPTPQWPTAQSQ